MTSAFQLFLRGPQSSSFHKIAFDEQIQLLQLIVTDFQLLSILQPQSQKHTEYTTVSSLFKKRIFPQLTFHPQSILQHKHIQQVDLLSTIQDQTLLLSL